MEFKERLLEGTFLRRYKRFFAEVNVRTATTDQTVVAHVPNTGSMKGLIESARPCKVTLTDDPKRTLKYTLQMLKDENSWVGVNTHLPNAIVAEAFENKVLEHWQKYTECKREVKISADSRIDLVLKNASHSHYVEVKNVTLSETSKCGRTTRALFPDAKTERGRKHLKELEKLAQQGHTAEMLFLVQRTDCAVFAPAEIIDPEYAKILKEVTRAGVLLSAYPVDFLTNGIKLRPQKLAVEL
jgi:sugar fermentation stimulation protein A